MEVNLEDRDPSFWRGEEKEEILPIRRMNPREELFRRPGVKHGIHSPLREGAQAETRIRLRQSAFARVWEVHGLEEGWLRLEFTGQKDGQAQKARVAHLAPLC
jgi:hypothetical protein